MIHHKSAGIFSALFIFGNVLDSKGGSALDPRPLYILRHIRSNLLRPAGCYRLHPILKHLPGSDKTQSKFHIGMWYKRVTQR